MNRCTVEHPIRWGPVRKAAVFTASAVLCAAAAAQDSGGPPDTSVLTAAGPIGVSRLASGLEHPWGMAFLPDGRLLVTERNGGSLRIVTPSGEVSEPIEGTPETAIGGQGGMLDVALDPDFESNRYVYLSFSEPGEGGSSTALGRGRLENDRIEQFEVIFSQQPKRDSEAHFGGRIAFTPDGRVFLTLGERFLFDPAQDLGTHLGKIVRVETDGSVPDGNPFAGRDDALPEIFSYGHRNIEAAAIHPQTGRLWVVEMGPLGGDELNVPEAGRNYGWPLVSAGMHYDGRDIPDPETEPDLAQAVETWTPVISPSGMIFYTGDAFPEWRGSALIGGLSAQGLVRVVIDGETVTDQERVPLGARIRDVEQAPDGTVYVLTDQPDGDVWRLAPLERGGAR